MSLGKKERRITISVGLIVGVTISTMLVKHALDVKEEQTAQKPGHYNSLESAAGKADFPPLPVSIKKAIPNGIVVYYEENRTSLSDPEGKAVNCWVIETQGSFRSERLFVLAEEGNDEDGGIVFFRAAEIYAKLRPGHEEDTLGDFLDEQKYRVIGENSSTAEQIVQVRNLSPNDLAQSLFFLNSLPMVKSARFSPWIPSR